MTGLKKFLLSLLIAVVLFGGFVAWAYSGLFDVLETTLFRQKVEEQVFGTFRESRKEITDHLGTLQQSFAGPDSMPTLATVFKVNQSADDIKKRENLITKLGSEYSLESLRIVGVDGALYYSSKLSDIRESSSVRVEYQPLSNVQSSIQFDKLLLKDGQAGDRFWVPDDATFLLTFPVRDQPGVFYGTMLASFGVRDIDRILEKSIPASLLGRARIAAPDRLILNYQEADSGLSDSIAEAKIDDGRGRLLLDSTSTGKIFAYYDTDPDLGLSFFVTVKSERLEFQSWMNIVLLAIVFLTVFLFAFLLLNLRHEPVALLHERIKRLQIHILQEYLERRESLEGTRWQSELRGRREEVRATIKRGLGRSQRKDSKIDDLIDKGWDEILEVIGSRPSRQVAANFDISRLEELVQKVIANYQQQGGTTAIAAPARPKSNIAQQKSSPPHLQSSGVSQSGMAGAIPSAKLDDDEADLEEVEEFDDAEPLDAGESIEEAESLEAIGEAEEVDALEEVETLEEMDAIEASDPASDAEVLEPVEVQEDIEEIEAAEVVEEIEEAETDLVVEAEDPQETLEEIEQLQDEGSKDAEALEELEHVETIAPVIAEEDYEEIPVPLETVEALTSYSEELIEIGPEEDIVESVEPMDEESATTDENSDNDALMPQVDDGTLNELAKKNVDFLPFYDEDIPSIEPLDLELNENDMFGGVGDQKGLSAGELPEMEIADLAEIDASLEEVEEFEEVEDLVEEPGEIPVAQSQKPETIVVGRTKIPTVVPFEQLDPVGAEDLVDLGPETGGISFGNYNSGFVSVTARAGSLEAPRRLEELASASRNTIDVRFMKEETVPEGGAGSWSFDIADGGVVRIPQGIFSGASRPESPLADLLSDMESRNSVTWENQASIAGLFRADEEFEDLTLSGGLPGGSEGGSQEGRSFYADRAKLRRELSFGPAGVDYDAFSSAFRGDESGKIKALYSFSKRFQAETSLLVRVGPQGLSVLRYLGLPFELPSEIHYQNEGEAMAELKKEPAIVLFKKPEAFQRLLDAPCVDPRLVKRLVMFPMRFEEQDAYCLLGYSRDIDLQGFVDSYIETLPKENVGA